MREDQVGAAAVDVEILAEVFPGHGGAFDMPARSAMAPGAVPARQVRRGGFPQYEVAGVALVRGDVDAGAGEELVGAAAGELAVIGETGDREQHVAVGGVGVAGGDQALDDLDHLGDGLSGARLDIRGEVAEGGNVGAVVFERLLGNFADRHAVFASPRVDLVVNVGDVAYIGHAREHAPEQADQHVVDHRGAGVADMGEVIDGRAAAIDTHVAGIDRDQRFPAFGEKVVQAQLEHGCGHR